VKKRKAKMKDLHITAGAVDFTLEGVAKDWRFIKEALAEEPLELALELPAVFRLSGPFRCAMMEMAEPGPGRPVFACTMSSSGPWACNSVGPG
jgi:hypothetical protein